MQKYTDKREERFPLLIFSELDIENEHLLLQKHNQYHIVNKTSKQSVLNI